MFKVKNSLFSICKFSLINEIPKTASADTITI